VSVITKYTKPDIPNAVWTIRDVLIITLCVLAGSILFYTVLLAFFGDNKATLRIARYVGSLLMIFLPLFWVKRKFGLSKEVLGLRTGNVTFSLHILLGIGAAGIYFLFIQLTPFGYGTIFTGLKKSYSYINLILMPLSISGFASIVLTPVGEEIMVRGFMYGHFRKKLGVAIGLILQAMVFALLHISPSIKSIQAFIIGVILGLLYEKTGSIYSSMICHGAINYIAIISMLPK
jgi:membrane protease YdiL (CAAX protease family)